MDEEQKGICMSCDGPAENGYVCETCYRDPETNNCVECGQHYSYVPYPYVCGPCVTKIPS